MYRALVCTYGRVLTGRPVTLISPLLPRVVCTRSYALDKAKAKPKDPEPSKNKDKDKDQDDTKDAKAGKGKGKGKDKVDKPKKNLKEAKRLRKERRVKTTVDESKPRFYREYNIPKTSTIPSINRHQLKELMNAGREDYTLIDLRTEAETVLSGDARIPGAHKIPTIPISNLDPPKPPKEVDDKTAKGKKSKKAPTKAQQKEETAKVAAAFKAAIQRDLFIEHHKLTNREWEKKFKFPKIDRDENVIFFSSSDVRSTAVANSATKLGYTNVKILEGGSREWNKYNNILGNK